VIKLRALLYKEWRDHRALCIGALVVFVLFAALAKILASGSFDPAQRTGYVLPSCLGVFALILAIEVVVRDIHTGAESTLLRLPVSRAMGWSAKALFVTLASVGFLLLLVVSEVALRILERRSALEGLVDMVQPTQWCLIAAIAAACASCACVLRRSVVAAFLGVALITACRCSRCVFPKAPRANGFSSSCATGRQPRSRHSRALPSLFGSFLAYRVRRADDFGLRRAAGAAIGAGIVLVPALAGTAQHSGWAFDIELFSKTAHVMAIAPSPDARFLAVQVSQQWKPRDCWIGSAGRRKDFGVRERYEVWLLERSTGVWKEIDDRFRTLWSVDEGWMRTDISSPSRVTGPFGDGGLVVERIDPIAGVVVESHPGSVPQDLVRGLNEPARAQRRSCARS
jgi:hypothetical protein